MDAARTEAKSSHRTLAEVVEDFKQRESTFNADLDVPLASLKMTEAGTVAVPDGRAFRVNDWSRSQLGALVGARWDRWFESASVAQIAEDLNRRFARADRVVRLRTAASQDCAQEGILRAFVTPSYTPITDSVIASDLATSLKATPADLRVLRCSVTDMTTSLVVAVGEPFRRGDGGRVGEVRGGLALRNSDTGFGSLTITTHLVRLVCTNGMTTPEPDAVVLRKAHRGLARESLVAALKEKLGDLPERLHRGADILERSANQMIDDVEPAVRAFLEVAHLPLRLAPGLLAAFEHEPHRSRYGIAQAVTLFAQRAPAEVRWDLERAAGAYLARTAN